MRLYSIILSISLGITTVYLCVSICSDTEEDPVKATASTRFGTKSARARKTSVDRASCDTRGTTGNTDTTTSEAGDGFEGRMTTPADGGPKHTKMAERVSLSEETEKMADRSTTASNGKKVVKQQKSRTTKSHCRKNAEDGRDRPHKQLAKSSRNKHLKLRKAVSKARLKSYGISV